MLGDSIVQSGQESELYDDLRDYALIQSMHNDADSSKYNVRWMEWSVE